MLLGNLISDKCSDASDMLCLLSLSETLNLAVEMQR